MTKTVILGTSFAAIFALSMIMVPAFAGGHLAIIGSDVFNHPTNSKVSITVSAPIPQDGSLGAFGFGAIGLNGVIAVTTHGGVGPDSEVQADQSDPVFHTHVVTLKTTGLCKTPGNPNGNPAGLAVASASFEDVGKLKVANNKVKVTGIPNSAVGDLSGDVVAFRLSVVGDPAAPRAICVNIVPP